MLNPVNEIVDQTSEKSLKIPPIFDHMVYMQYITDNSAIFNISISSKGVLFVFKTRKKKRNHPVGLEIKTSFCKMLKFKKALFSCYS